MRTYDKDYLRSIAEHPHVARWSGAKSFDVQNRVYCRLDGGYIVFSHVAFDCWDIHISMLPKSPDAMPQVLRAIDWLCEKYEVHKFTASIPEANRPARILAKRCGFTQCGRVSDFAVIDGKRSDVLIFERGKAWKP